GQTRVDRFGIVPSATQRARKRRATATGHALAHGWPSASTAATAAAVTLEAATATTSDAPSVARSLLVPAATTAVSPAWSTLACCPSNRRLITATAGRGGPLWAATAVNHSTSEASGETRTSII